MNYQNTGLRLLFQDSLINLTRQGASLVLVMFISILLARGLGTEGRGIYTLVVLAATLVTTLLNAGIAPAVIYFTARDNDQLETVIRETIALSFWISLFGIIAGGLLIYFTHRILFPGVPLQSLFIALTIVPTTLFLNNLTGIFQGTQDFRTFSLIQISPHIATLLLLLILVWGMDADVMGALISLTLGRALAIVLAIWQLRKRLGQIRSVLTCRLNIEYARSMLHYGARAYFANIGALLNYRIDVILLNLLSGTSAVGIYDVSVGLGERLWTISQAVATVIFPRSAAQSKQNKSQDVIISIVARHVFWFSVIIAIIVGLVAEQAVILLYGVQYQQAAVVFRWLLPGIVTWNLARIIASDLAGRGKPEMNAKYAAMGVLVNVVFNLFLIPQLDVVGAAIATTISYTFLALVFVISFGRITGVRWQKIILPQYDDWRRWNELFQTVRRFRQRQES